MAKQKEGVIRYFSKDVVQMGNESALRVEILGKELLLPGKLLSEDNKLIFILDPRKIDVQLAGETALLMLMRMQFPKAKDEPMTVRFLTPESRKSVGMINNVVDYFSSATGYESRLDSTMFLKDVSQETLQQRLGSEALIIPYTSITGISSFIGISKANAEVLKTEIEQDIQLVLVDDVISTGGTVRAIQTLLAKIMDQPETAYQDLPVYAVVREVAEQASIENDPVTWFYSIIIPILNV